MYDRLLDKNKMPTPEEFLEHIGKIKELFETLDIFLRGKNSEKVIKLDAHSRCWKLSYHIKKVYVCDIIPERDTFTVVTRLSEEVIGSIYGGLLPYAKECIDNSPFRHRGWIEYRVLSPEHLEDVKTMLSFRANNKQNTNPTQ